MSLKIVNEYITEVLQLNAFKKELEDELKKLEPKPAVEVKPDPDSESEREKNLALLQKLGADINPRLRTNQMR